MKTLQCEICNADIRGEDFDQWFQAARGHWMAEHADVMKAMAGKPKEEGEKWIAEARKNFDAA